MQRNAFTLAELLLSVAIIGVVLILTIPAVTGNFNNKSSVVALQRTYTSINDAVELLMMTDRAKSLDKSTLYISSTSDTVTSTAGEFLTKYFKVILDCGTSPGDCFAASYKNLDKDSVALPSSGDAYCVAVSAGASICITPPDNTDYLAARVLVDVNGPSKPNVAGRDLFVFYIYLDGFTGDRGDEASASFCRSSYGAGCFKRIVNADWVMDY